MSEYLILIYSDADAQDQAMIERDERIMNGHLAFAEKNAAAIRGGAALQPVSTATSVRPDGDGFSVTDGPFVETKEAIGGYYLVEADDLAAAVDMAKQIPVLAGGGLEVRPVMVFG